MNSMRSGVAGLKSSFGFGRDNYSQSGFLGDDDEDDKKRPEAGHPDPHRPRVGSASSQSPKQTEAATQPPKNESAKQDQWKEAANIRAQLEEELRLEQVSRGSPSQDWSKPRTASDGMEKRDRRRSHKKGSPDALFAVSSPGFPDAVAQDLSPKPQLGDPWQTSPPPEAAVARSVSKSSSAGAAQLASAAGASAFGGIWDVKQAPGTTFAWPQKPVAAAPTHPSPTPPAAASATAAANSLASGFAMEGVADSFEVSDKPPSPFGVPGNSAAAPAAPARLQSSTEFAEASLEPAPGMFDEAILAALAALPQQALVSVLRRLAQRRPTEVALAFDNGSTSSSPERAPVTASVPLSASVQPAEPEEPAADSPQCASPTQATEPAVAIAAAVPAEDAVAPAEVVLEPIEEATPAADVPPEAMPASSASPPPAAAVPASTSPPAPEENFAERLANASEAVMPASNGPASPTSSEPTPPVASIPATSTGVSIAAAASADPAATSVFEASPWPATAQSGVSGAAADFASTDCRSPWPPVSAAAAPQQAADLWPAPAESTNSSSPAQPWPSAGGASPWPATAPGTKTDWPVF